MSLNELLPVLDCNYMLHQVHRKVKPPNLKISNLGMAKVMGGTYIRPIISDYLRVALSLYEKRVLAQGTLFCLSHQGWRVVITCWLT